MRRSTNGQFPVGGMHRFAPFNVIGNIYYVGTETVSSFLITTPDGHFLIDGVMPQTVPQIVANINALGFDIRDVKFLLNSHAHFDHAGGLAGLQRLSDARMVASAADRRPLDGDELSLGGVTLTAHLTPGHTPGCTSWTMNVAGTDGVRHVAFFHCSSTIGGQTLAPEAYPGVVSAYRSTFERVRAMHADVLLANHDGLFDLHAKRARQLAGDVNAFVNPDELQTLNTSRARAFEAELARQHSAAQ